MAASSACSAACTVGGAEYEQVEEVEVEVEEVAS
jgi:hypothetical protein